MLRLDRAPFAVIAAVFALVAIPAALAETPYSDPSGDSKTAPDITQVVIANDVSGVITIRVTTVAPLVQDSAVFVDIDSDSNPATGSLGAEYSILAGTGGAQLLKWDGAKFGNVTAPTLSAAVSGSTVEIKIGRQDIGNVARFGFVAAAVLFDANRKFMAEDDAPDGGEYIYVLSFPQCANGKDDDGDGKIDGKDLGCSSRNDNLERDDPVSFRAGKATVAPAKPRAGRAVVVSVPVTRVETGVRITSGKVTCAAKAWKKPLRGAGKVTRGRASCAFALTAATKGKTARGTITVTALGRATVVPFSFKVR